MKKVKILFEEIGSLFKKNFQEMKDWPLEQKLKIFLVLFFGVFGAGSITLSYIYFGIDNSSQSYITQESSIQGSIVNSPDTSLLTIEDSSTVFNLEGNLTTENLTMGMGGSLNLFAQSQDYFDYKPMGLAHRYNFTLKNVLIKTAFGDAFLKSFPAQMTYFGICNNQITDCDIFDFLKYDSMTKLEYIINFNRGEPYFETQPLKIKKIR